VQQSFDIRKNQLEFALLDFAAQAGIQVVMQSSTVEGLKARRVVGRMTARDALRSLINGAAVDVEWSGASMVTIRPAQVRVQPVSMQQPAAAAAAPVMASESPPPAAGLEEIVVTAQKRSENLQNVPISITALEAVTADKLGVNHVNDLAFSTPGLVMHHQALTLQPTLRGIAQTNAAAGDESPISIYVDNVYYASMTGGIFSFNNIERIEVLKGPQGTLFGRNAVGGVIHVITKAPSETPSVAAHVGYGNYNTYEGDFYGATGIREGVATDLAIYFRRQKDGFGTNLTTGHDTFASRDFAIRNKWLLKPTDSAEITLAADYTHGEDPMGLAKDSLPGTTKKNGPPHRGGFFDLQGDVDDKVVFRQWGGSAQVDQEFGWSNLVSITAYRETSPYYIWDNDATALPANKRTSNNKTHQFTQEFQLISLPGSPIKWIAGLFYLNNRAFVSAVQTGTSVARPVTFRQTDATNKTESIAGFGEVTVPLGASTNVTAGLRYTSDKQHISGAIYSDSGLAPRSIVNNEATFGKLTWRLSIDHRFSNDLMVYASYNRGFKSGVFNATAPADPAVKPSVLDAYQAGFKSEWLGGKLRLNGSAFWYDYKDIQLTATLVGVSRLYNAGAGRIKGADLDFEFIPVHHLRLSGGVAYTDATYTDFQGAPTATPNPTGGGYNVAPADATGNEMIYTPKWSYNVSALYNIPTSIGAFDIAGNLYYNGGYFPDPANQFYQKSYHLINGSIGWTSNNEMFSAKLWAKNLTNVHYYNHITLSTEFVSASPSPPRTFGITLGFKWRGS
jgi:iron complex outermembrane receptor protein